MMIFAKGWSDRKDGPGHRRIYYLKGCNLRCRWCGSPESIARTPQMLFYPGRQADFAPDCLCAKGAIANGRLERRLCEACAEKGCRGFRHPAVEWAGDEIAPEELLREAIRFQKQWPEMAGVTFGGGEPTLQAAELVGVLEELKSRRIHAAIESNASTDAYIQVAQRADYVISDLKAGHEERFSEGTGGTGGTFRKVLENLGAAAENFRELLIRVPVITGFNDSPEELGAMADILAGLSRRRRQAIGVPLQVEILQLHHFGEPKYAALGLRYEFAGAPPPSPVAIAGFERRLADHGILIARN